MKHSEPVYELNAIHAQLVVAHSPKGFADFPLFRECYLEMTAEQKDHIQRLIKYLCDRCSNMGPIAAAELLWKAGKYCEMNEVTE